MYGTRLNHLVNKKTAQKLNTLVSTHYKRLSAIIFKQVNVRPSCWISSTFFTLYPAEDFRVSVAELQKLVFTAVISKHVEVTRNRFQMLRHISLRSNMSRASTKRAYDTSISLPTIRENIPAQYSHAS